MATRIWHFSHLMPGAIVGDHRNIGQNVFIDNNVIVGNGCKIQINVSQYNGVKLEDDVFSGPSVNMPSLGPARWLRKTFRAMPW